MPVRVRLFGRLRGIVGCDELVVQGSPATVGELVRLLAQQYDTRIQKELLDEGGDIDHSYAVFIGGQRAGGTDSAVQEGQEVTITSMIAGGFGC
ncbi:MAG: MoaD/ThiS family protein [Chloroflexi bacterium]|nr:MoaD/ThiS family protein [Chloroflexota bacterium]